MTQDQNSIENYTDSLIDKAVEIGEKRQYISPIGIEIKKNICQEAVVTNPNKFYCIVFKFKKMPPLYLNTVKSLTDKNNNIELVLSSGVKYADDYTWPTQDSAEACLKALRANNSKQPNIIKLLTCASVGIYP